MYGLCYDGGIEWRLIRREGTYDWGLCVTRLFRIGDEK